MFLLLLVPICISLIFLYKRHVCNPARTNLALSTYIYDSCAKLPYDEIVEPDETTVNYSGIQQTAHRDIFSSKDHTIIEFDVHPSTFSFLSASQSYVFKIKNSDDYSAFKQAVLQQESLTRWIPSPDEYEQMYHTRRATSLNDEYTLKISNASIAFKPDIVDYLLVGIIVVCLGIAFTILITIR